MVITTIFYIAFASNYMYLSLPWIFSIILIALKIVSYDVLEILIYVRWLLTRPDERHY